MPPTALNSGQIFLTWVKSGKKPKKMRNIYHGGNFLLSSNQHVCHLFTYSMFLWKNKNKKNATASIFLFNNFLRLGFLSHVNWGGSIHGCRRLTRLFLRLSKRLNTCVCLPVRVWPHSMACLCNRHYQAVWAFLLVPRTPNKPHGHVKQLQ